MSVPGGSLSQELVLEDTWSEQGAAKGPSKPAPRLPMVSAAPSWVYECSTELGVWALGRVKSGCGRRVLSLILILVLTSASVFLSSSDMAVMAVMAAAPLNTDMN